MLEGKKEKGRNNQNQNSAARESTCKLKKRSVDIMCVDRGDRDGEE